MKTTILIIVATLALARPIAHADEVQSAPSFDWEWRLMHPLVPRGNDAVNEWMLNAGRITQSQFDAMKRNDAEQDEMLRRMRR